MKYCEYCGLSEEEYGYDFVINKQGEWVCEEHTEIELGGEE